LYPTDAFAVPLTGGGFGSNNGSTISGVYGGNGTVYWQEIPNVDKGPHLGISSDLKNTLQNIKNKYTIKAAPGQDFGGYNRQDVAEDATRAIFNQACGGFGGGTQAPLPNSCPLWYLNKTTGSSGDVRTWYKVP